MPPSSHWALPIVRLLFLWLTAIVSIVFASQVNQKWRMADFAGAALAS